MLSNLARENDPQASADAQKRGQQRDAPSGLLVVHLVASNRVRQRQDAAADPLDHASRDQHRERRDHAQQRAARHNEQDCDQHPALSEHVAESSSDGRGDG
jgi:hypothetical protein